MTKVSKAGKQSTRKKASKTSASALNTCPVGAAGWCAYPFSVAQLQKRMKRIAEGEKKTQELAGAGSR
jgi:hypothetical protein